MEGALRQQIALAGVEDAEDFDAEMRRKGRHGFIGGLRSCEAVR
jgi:hypothetical protein